MSVQNCMAGLPIVVEVFQSGTKWWTDQLSDYQTVDRAESKTHTSSTVSCNADGFGLYLLKF